MKELSVLINEIRKENKMSIEDLFGFLEESIAEEREAKCTYKMLYQKAYGKHLTKNTAKMWVENVPVTDKSGRATGEKWTVDQCVSLGNKLNVNWSEINEYEWYAVMNAWYSDFYRTAKKYELENEAEFFADLALDYFYFDEDGNNKTVFDYYFNHVV